MTASPAAEVDDRLDPALAERLAQAAVDDVLDRRRIGQLAARDRDGQVEAGLGRGVAQRLVAQARLDEHVRRRPEQDRRQRHERDEGQRQPGPDPTQPAHPAQRAAL